MVPGRHLLIGICLILLLSSCDQVSQHPQVSEGRSLHKAGRFEDAIPLYQQALKENPNDALAFTEWGEALAALGRDGEAGGKFRQALALLPDFIPAQEGLADALTARDRQQEALEIYTRLAAKGDKRAVNGMGVALCRMREYDQSLRQLRKAVAADPASVSAHVNLAIILFFLDEDDAAIKQLHKALEIDPDSIPALSQMGRFMQSHERKDEAREYYSRAIQLIPEGQWDWWHMDNAFGALEYAHEDPEGARRLRQLYASLLQQALSVNPHSRTLLGYLGSELNYRDEDRSRECFDRLFALDLKPPLTDAGDRMRVSEILQHIRDYSQLDIYSSINTSIDLNTLIGLQGGRGSLRDILDRLQTEMSGPIFSYLDKNRPFRHTLFLGDPTFVAGLPSESLASMAHRVRSLPPVFQKRVSYDFLEVPLGEVAARFEKATGIPFVIQEIAGSQDPQIKKVKDREVTLRVTHMRLESFLNWIERLTDTHYAYNGREIEIGHGRQSRTLRMDSILQIICAEENKPLTRTMVCQETLFKPTRFFLVSAQGIVLAESDFDHSFLARNAFIFKEGDIWREYFTGFSVPAGFKPIYVKRSGEQLIVIAGRKVNGQKDEIRLFTAGPGHEAMVSLSPYVKTSASDLLMANFAFDFKRRRLFWIDSDLNDWPSEHAELTVKAVSLDAASEGRDAEVLSSLDIKNQVKSFYEQDGYLYLTDDIDRNPLCGMGPVWSGRTRRMDCVTFQVMDLGDTPFGWGMDFVLGKYGLAARPHGLSICLVSESPDYSLRSNALGLSPPIGEVTMFKTGKLVWVVYTRVGPKADADLLTDDEELQSFLNDYFGQFDEDGADTFDPVLDDQREDFNLIEYAAFCGKIIESRVAVFTEQDLDAYLAWQKKAGFRFPYDALIREIKPDTRKNRE